MEFDIQPNRNGRYYPPEVLKKAVADLQERIKARRLMGEVDPPGDGRTRMSHVSHVITDLRVDAAGNMLGDMEILDTPAGKLLRESLLGGAPMHASVRGIGSVSNGRVGDDYKITSISMGPGPTPWESIVDKLGRLADEPKEHEDE